jgi:hypothetical protein
MASEGLQRLVNAAIADESIIVRMQEDLDEVVAEFGLDEEERAALTSNDPALVAELGRSLGLEDRSIARLQKNVCD